MYDIPHRLTYAFPAVAFNAADIVRIIKNPRTGAKGKVRSCNIYATTTFAGATTLPKVQVGDGVTANKYADVQAGALAAGAAYVGKDAASGILALGTPHILTATNGDLTVTFKAATGGGAAGVADIHLEVEWG